MTRKVSPSARLSHDLEGRVAFVLHELKEPPPGSCSELPRLAAVAGGNSLEEAA